MPTPDGAPSRLGFDAIRALRNGTGLGNYARAVLTGLAEVAPDRELRLYSPRVPVARFSGFATSIGARTSLPALPWRAPVARNLWRTFRLGHVAARDRIDLYHGLTQEIPRDLPARRIRSVLTVPDLLYLTQPEQFPALDRRSYLWRYRWSIEHADALIAISHGTCTDLQHHFGVDPSRIVVIPPAVDPRFSSPPPDPQIGPAVRQRLGLPPRYVVLVGTLEPRKNQRLAVRALAESADRELAVVLVGRDGGSEAPLRQLARECGVASRIHFLSAIGSDDLLAILAGARLASYLSTAEGFGMPIVEAQAAGLPVVAVRGGNLEDAGGPAARYVDPDDPAALATEWERLGSDGADRDRVIAESRRHAATFDRRALAGRLLTLYDAVHRGDPLPTLALVT